LLRANHLRGSKALLFAGQVFTLGKGKLPVAFSKGLERLALNKNTLYFGSSGFMHSIM
jgi:hypothetical protein